MSLNQDFTWRSCTLRSCEDPVWQEDILDIDAPTESEIETIFNKWEQLAEYTPGPIPDDAPPYVPTTKDQGPKPITIEQYRRRNNKRQQQQVPQIKQKKKRGGKAFNKRKDLAILYNSYNLSTTNKEKQLLKSKIKQRRSEI